MCLLVAKEKQIETAQEEIKVYKRVDKKGKVWEPLYVTGRTFQYNRVINAYDEDNPIEHLKLRKLVLTVSTFFCIEGGFHCTTTKKPKVQMKPNVICIIPKGAEYCYGVTEDVVSNKLIVFKHKWNYWFYRLKHRK